jgi:hypothetical protein
MAKSSRKTEKPFFLKKEDKIKPIKRHHENKYETRQRNTKNICTRTIG